MAWAEPRVLIIGAGAVGSFIAARLALAGVRVTLVGRRPLVEVAQTTGLRLIEPEGERTTPQLAAFTSLAAACAAGEYDLGIITAKAYDTQSILDELRAATPQPPPLLSMQNGVGNEEALTGALGRERVIAGALDTPLSVPSPGVVAAHRSRYRAGIAPVGSSALAKQALDLLLCAGLEVNLFDDYRRLKWSKLLLNLPANASCAILDWTPARCMADRVMADLEARAWQEAFRVMRALRIQPVNLARYPLAWIAPLVPALPPRLLARAMAQTVAGGRGTKMPSFQVALSTGKPSEVAWLNGAVARVGRTAGVPTPVNATLTAILLAISSAPESWLHWKDRPDKVTGEIAAATHTS